MSLRKRVAKLELDVYLAELETKATEKRLEQLECPHTELEYGKMLSGLMFNPKTSWREMCKMCGKVIRGLENDEYLSIEEARLVAELSAVNDAIKANKKHVADDCSTGIKK